MKAKKLKPKAAACVFCGAPDPTTWDHVPPKNLFRKPRPSNLLTVPSCQGCNEGASKDDEYFRLMLSIRQDMRAGPARWAADVAMRSLERPEARGLLHSLLHILEEVDIRTPAGIYLERRGVYTPQMARLYRVVGRTVPGLFYHERGYALPQEYHVTTYLLPDAWDVERLVASIARKALSMAHLVRAQARVGIIGRHEFRYQWQAVPEDRNASAWLLTFYQRIEFLTITTPPRSRG